MSTTEHLELILAYCQQNLAIAERRTLGKWKLEETAGVFNAAVKCEELKPWTGQYVANTIETSDAEFIATCAGAAEAGWWATIAVVEMCRQLPSPDSGLIIKQILASYPLELIQTQSAK